MSGPTVVVCADCAGLTFTLAACRCTWGGARFIVEPGRSDGQPYPDCELCQGLGTVAQPCHRCGQLGKCRAQLVFTVVNADTGAVASASVTPGTIEPSRTPDGRWALALTPIITELAATVGATGLVEVTRRWQPMVDESIALPPQWHPDLPADRREALVAAALARHAGDPWRVFHGRTVAPPPVDPGARLARLCRLADQLLLDLVVEARDPGYGELVWDVRFDLPGAAVPATARGHGADLPAALVATSVADAFDGLAQRGLGAPAHYLRPGADVDAATRRPVEPIDLDQVERRVLRDCAEHPGAQAIWRDGRWWHTTLRPDRTVEKLRAEPTGQVSRRLDTILVRTWEPPAPDWLGDPIPYHDCPDCAPDSLLRACPCTLGDRTADPACADCAGAGVRAQQLPCHTCGDSRRVYLGAVLTVTDLAGRVVHENWRHQPVKTPLVATQPGGKPVVQLPADYRVARLAHRLEYRPDDLTELDGGQQLCQDLRDGVVTVHRSGDDPLVTQLARVTRGQPGARLLLAAGPPAAPPLAELIRIVLGLRLAIGVTVQDHRRNAGDPLKIHGTSWQVEVTADDPAARFTDLPTWPSLAAAVAHRLAYLELALAATVPADPDRPIPVPRTARPRPVAAPDRLIARLGAHHAGKPITVRFDRAGCTILLHEYGVSHVLTTAATLAEAVAALGLPVGG